VRILAFVLPQTHWLPDGETEMAIKYSMHWLVCQRTDRLTNSTKQRDWPKNGSHKSDLVPFDQRLEERLKTLLIHTFENWREPEGRQQQTTQTSDSHY